VEDSRNEKLGTRATRAREQGYLARQDAAGSGQWMTSVHNPILKSHRPLTLSSTVSKASEQTTPSSHRSVRSIGFPVRFLLTYRTATASYRLLPCIHIRSPIPQEHQEKFKACFPPGVIAIEPDASGQPQCVVKNPRKDTVSREVLRHPEFADLVELTRIRDHFICTF
jgi:hypothetical protein